jgi:two-component system, OmpR family, KDP operon response regulator KdpE
MDVSHVLLIGDQPEILRTLRRNLTGRGYEVNIALDDHDAFNMGLGEEVDLYVIILDFMTIDVDGLGICKQIRRQSEAPIIVLSTVGAEQNKIKALDLGADDYLEMPFSMEEFLARVRSALRRWASQKHSLTGERKVIASSGLVIDCDSHQVLLDGEEIHLTPTEFRLLQYLAQNQGKVVSHRQILQAVWGAEYGDEREYLRVYISQLRHKIEGDALNPSHILTEPGVGYRFC